MPVRSRYAREGGRSRRALPSVAPEDATTTDDEDGEEGDDDGSGWSQSLESQAVEEGREGEGIIGDRIGELDSELDRPRALAAGTIQHPPSILLLSIA